MEYNCKIIYDIVHHGDGKTISENGQRPRG